MWSRSIRYCNRRSSEPYLSGTIMKHGRLNFQMLFIPTGLSGNYGRTLIHPTKNDLLFYSDKSQTDKLYDIIENADYMINVANLKPHSCAGITLTAKNHFGSQSREGAYHLHYSHLSPDRGQAPTNAGYHKYRVLVDLMGSKYLGQNTLLYVIDGLYGGGACEGGPPVDILWHRLIMTGAIQSSFRRIRLHSNRFVMIF